MHINSIDQESVDVETWIEQRIAENGYAQISVYDPPSGLPGFAYTLGLEASRRTPELLCMGVAPDIAAQLFAICIEGHDDGFCDLSIGNQDVSDLVDGHTLRFRQVAPAMVLKANSVRPLRRADISKAIQLLMPDNNGHFPGDPCCDPNIAAAQDPDWLLAQVSN